MAFRINQDAEGRLAGLSDAVQAVRDQLAAQSSSLGQLRAAEGEVRRLVGDKAGLADVQALLQAHSPPTLVPVSAVYLRALPTAVLDVKL